MYTIKQVTWLNIGAAICAAIGTVIGVYFALPTPDIESHPIKPIVEPIDQPQIPLTNERIDKLHDALGRAFHIDQSCYDIKKDYWLVHVPFRPLVPEWSDGWYIESATSNVQYMEFGNGTYSITNIGAIFNNETFPDVTGMLCKPHVPEPDREMPDDESEPVG